MSAQLAFVLAKEGKRRAASRHEAEIVALVPLAQRLAQKAGRAGVTVGNLRVAANLGTGTGQERRGYSWLAVVLRRAGLVNTHARRMSPLPGTRNDNDVYVLPEFA